MKPLITTLFIIFSFLIFSQNVIEISVSKISRFSTYQKDSIHTMLMNSDLLPYNDIYKPTNLKFIINHKIITYSLGLFIVPRKRIVPVSLWPIRKINGWLQSNMIFELLSSSGIAVTATITAVAAAASVPTSLTFI